MFEWLTHSETRLRMLKMFFQDVDTPLYGLEIAQALRASPGTTHRELNAMLKQGIISKKREGALVMYRLNTQHPYFFELKKAIFPPKRSNRVLFASDFRLTPHTSPESIKDINLFLDYAAENASELVLLGNIIETLSENVFQTYLVHKPLFDRLTELSHHLKVTYLIGDEDYLLRLLCGGGDGKRFFDAKIVFAEEYHHPKYGIYATFGHIYDDFSRAKASRINAKEMPNLALLEESSKDITHDKHQMEVAHVLDYLRRKGTATRASDARLQTVANELIQDRHYAYVVMGRSQKSFFKELKNGIYFNPGSWQGKDRQFVEIDKDGGALVSMKNLR